MELKVGQAHLFVRVDRQRLITKGKCRHHSCSFANGNQMRTEPKCISVFPSKGARFSKTADLGGAACRPFRARGSPDRVRWPEADHGVWRPELPGPLADAAHPRVAAETGL